MTGEPVECIVLGGSAGALEALNEFLPLLPREFAVPIVIVLHLPRDHDSLLPALFAARCVLPVREAQHGAPLERGITFAPPDYHLAIEPERTLSLALEAPVRFSRPSIDVLFESAAWALGPNVLGILLSGANDDGARGLRAIRDAGGRVWIQHPATAQLPAMPDGALNRVSPDELLAPEYMPARLLELTRYLESEAV